MKILPNALKSENINGSFCIDGDAKIYSEEEFTSQARRFGDLVYENCGFRLQDTADIQEAQIIFAKDAALADEGYVIMISQGVATVTAATDKGAFYAVESLRQILDLHAGQERIYCNDGYVEDSPRFPYRGFMLDIARHYFDLPLLKQVVELMSQVKLNVLHLHLTDDQGFRLQIDKYPLLTEIGGKRAGSEVTGEDGESYIDDIPHAGYLTKNDVRELVAYAAERKVEIVPEIDLPGHIAAALAAYPEYSCTGAVTEVRRKWSAAKDILCAGNDGVYTFVEDILDEVCELFPSRYIHLGGEDTAKDRWCNCKLCRERMSELKLDSFEQLQTYMIEVFRKHLESKGKTVIIRNDGVTQDTDERVVSQVWTPVKLRRAAREAHVGRQIIVSPRSRVHFNHGYNIIPLKRTLRVNPYRSVKKADHNLVLGIEGALWTQHVDSEEQLFFHLLPRLDALAECAWSKRHKDFLPRLQKRLAYYEQEGLNYNRKFVRKAVKKPVEPQQGDTL